MAKLEGSWHPCHGRHCREPGGNIKINLPIFKDEDKKDAITYQSWRIGTWLIITAQGAETIPSSLTPSDPFKGTLGELVRSSGMDIALDDVLSILDEHYNNVQAMGCSKSRVVPAVNGGKGDCIRCSFYRGTSKSWLLHSQSTSLPIAWPSWSVITSMVGYPNSLKPWCPTWRPAHRRNHTLTISGLQGKPKREDCMEPFRKPNCQKYSQT